jgi:hypothetical protein
VSWDLARKCLARKETWSAITTGQRTFSADTFAQDTLDTFALVGLREVFLSVLFEGMLWGVDAFEVKRARAKLALFVADVFASVPRKDQRAKGDCYLRGLMLDGRRKSVQAMAERLPDGNEQNLQQFVNQSHPVQHAIARFRGPSRRPASHLRRITYAARFALAGQGEWAAE